MYTNINKKIVEYIKNGDFDPAVKEILLKLLILELDNSREARWRFSEKYDNEISRYVKNFSGEKYDNRLSAPQEL